MFARVLILVGFVGICYALNGQLTRYCSYSPCCKSKISPPYTAAEKKNCPGTSECDDYSACKYEGEFAFCGKKNHSYVIDNNMVAMFSSHGDINKYKNKMIRITQGSKSIDAMVCDTCSDSDCDGCCTKNAKPSGYLIDLEANTMQRFGGNDGKVTWTCINC